MRNIIRLSRKELYDRIWNEPLRIIAKELGLSDTGLGKLCRRNGIPTPPSGFHLMKPGLKKDKAVRALPKLEAGQQETLTFYLNADSKNNDTTGYKAEFDTLLASAPTEVTTEQKRTIRACIKHIRSHLHKSKLDDRGIMRIPTEGYPVRVAPHSVDRAMKLLGSFLDHLYRIGAEIDSSTLLDKNLLYFGYQGYRFKLNVEEFSNRQEVPPEKRPKRYPGYEYPSDSWTLVPTGKLEMRLNGPGYGNMKIHDGKLTIESLQEKLLYKMYVHACEKRKKYAAEAIRRDRAIEYLREKDKLRQQLEHQELRQKQLHREALQWEKADRLRRYVNQVESRGYDSSNINFESPVDWQDWLNWVKSYIDSLDPITNSTSGITPPPPSAKEFTEVPYYYLQYDNPEEADEAQNNVRY